MRSHPRSVLRFDLNYDVIPVLLIYDLCRDFSNTYSDSVIMAKETLWQEIVLLDSEEILLHQFTRTMHNSCEIDYCIFQWQNLYFDKETRSLEIFIQTVTGQS